MDVAELAWIVQTAIDRNPPAELREWCGDQYRPYYHLLHLLAHMAPDGACVELGVEKGRGSFAMALSGRETHGFDHTQRDVEIHRLSVRFRNYHFHEGPSIPPPDGWSLPVAVLHVDTEHSYAMAREEYNGWRKYLVPGAIVCFDDTHAMSDEVGHFVVSLKGPTIFDDRLHECGYAVTVVGR